MSCTTASRRPRIRFTSVDLPTFGPSDDGDHRRRRRGLLDRLGDVFGAELPVAFVDPGAVARSVIVVAPGPLLSTSSSRCAITSDSVMSLVSTTIASSAARSGDTARVESRWSRRCTSASTAS